MPVVFQKMIYRKDMQANPEYFYVFGDNEQRVGKGGQALEMRGEPNAIGVRTKARPLRNVDSYWSDKRLAENCFMVYQDFATIIRALQRGDTVVFPTDGLGTGEAELTTRAPKTLAFIEMMIAFCGTFNDEISPENGGDPS